MAGNFNYFWQGFPAVQLGTGQGQLAQLGPGQTTNQTPLGQPQVRQPATSANKVQTASYLAPINQAQSYQEGHQSDSDYMDIDLKIINPGNKKDFRMYILRHVSSALNSPSKIKDEITKQYGESIPLSQNMDIGYFHHSKKMWIDSRLDVNDMWRLIAMGKQVTFWCMAAENGKKRPHGDENEIPAPTTKKSTCSRKTLIKEYEQELKKKHEGSYTQFQYKLWAEMYAVEAHDSLDKPPAAAMFNRDTRHKSRGTDEFMVSVISKLCNALTPNQENAMGDMSTGSSMLRKAELRSMYIKQLGELKELSENGMESLLN